MQTSREEAVIETSRSHTKEMIVQSTAWLSTEQVNASNVLDLKRRAEVFSVEWQGQELYPSYQFDALGQPLPFIKKIISALGADVDPWVIAAWFHFPNGWITDTSGAPVSPKDALGSSEIDLVHAAKMRLSSYVA